MNRPKTKAARELDQHNGYGKVGVAGSPIEGSAMLSKLKSFWAPWIRNMPPTTIRRTVIPHPCSSGNPVGQHPSCPFLASPGSSSLLSRYGGLNNHYA